MYNSALITALFPNGGETYKYSELKEWLMSQLGLSARQAAGTVGAEVRYGYITVATYASQTGEAIFVR